MLRRESDNIDKVGKFGYSSEEDMSEIYIAMKAWF